MGEMRISGGGYGYQPPAAAAKDAAPARAKAREDRPTLAEQMLEAREKAQKARERFRLTPSNRRYGDAPIEAYSRLARARNAAQVSSAAGYARRQILQLKAARRQDPDHARQIQGAINQLQKAVGRAGKKRRDLAREELAEKRRAKLEREEQLRRARRLQQQLRNQRTMRVLRESGYIREAEADNRLNTHLDAANQKLREQFEAISGAAGGGGAQDAAIARYAAQAASLEAPPPESTVTAEA